MHHSPCSCRLNSWKVVDEFRELMPISNSPFSFLLVITTSHRAFLDHVNGWRWNLLLRPCTNWIRTLFKFQLSSFSQITLDWRRWPYSITVTSKASMHCPSRRCEVAWSLFIDEDFDWPKRERSKRIMTVLGTTNRLYMTCTLQLCKHLL